MTYLIDSHTLFWFFSDDKRLSKNAKEILDEAEEGKVNIIIPSIIVLELMSILEKKISKNILMKYTERTK